jgi:hypothetical protein
LEFVRRNQWRVADKLEGHQDFLARYPETDSGFFILSRKAASDCDKVAKTAEKVEGVTEPWRSVNQRVHGKRPCNWVFCSL